MPMYIIDIEIVGQVGVEWIHRALDWESGGFS